LIPGSARFSLLHSVHTNPGAYPASYPMGVGDFSQGCEADHLPPSSAEVKEGGTVHPLPYMSSWHSAYRIKHMDNFTFLGFFIVCVVIHITFQEN
jgi:hypothetical protein